MGALQIYYARLRPEYDLPPMRCCAKPLARPNPKSELHQEICSACHPFFTGRQKLIDTEGRVERFTKKFGAQSAEARKTADKAAKAARPQVKIAKPMKPLDAAPKPAKTPKEEGKAEGEGAQA